MLHTLGDVLPQAVGIAITPFAIVFVILMLISDRGRVTAPVFVVGWVVAVAGITLVALALADSADAATDPDTRDGIHAIQLVLGLLFVFLAVQVWRSRPRSDGPDEEPKIFRMVDSLTPVKAVGLGVAVATVIAPKNLALEVGAGSTMAKAGLSIGGDIGAVIGFTVIASLAVLVPVIAVLIMGDRTDAALARAKEWLMSNNTAIMLVLMIVLAAHFIGKGLGITG